MAMETTSAWYWIFRGFIAIVAIIGNAVVIGLIITKHRLHTTPNWFIVSLAAADLCVGIFLIPSSFVCTFWATCDWPTQVTFYGILLHVSVGNLCVLTMDRYLAIVHPFRHANIMTRCKKFLFTALAWCVPIIVILIEVFYQLFLESESKKRIVHRVYIIVLLTSFQALPCAIMLSVYLRIFCISRKLANRVFQQEQQIHYNYDNYANNFRQPRNREGSALLAALFVVLIFVICWSMAFYRTLCLVFNLCTVSETLRDISRSLMVVTSAANPIVWSLVKTDIRREFLKFIKFPRILRARSVTSEVTVHRSRSQVSIF